MTVYHLVFAFALAVYGPVLAWRWLLDPRYRRGTRERQGRVVRLPPDRPVVWVHGVSVGEVKAAATLIEGVRRRYPQLRLVVSSTTPTGHGLARQLYPDLDVIYYPLDFGRFPGRALDRIHPGVVLLMELEVWPNFLQAAARRGIPVCVINGRISERSFRGYRLVRGFLPQFDLIERFCVQDETYRRRLLLLDVEDARIHVTGNMKYDTVRLASPNQASRRLREWLAGDGRLVVVGGSTHAEEELRLAAAIRRAEQRLKRRVRLVVAPRHPERAESIVEALQSAGQECQRWSALGERRPPLGGRVLVVDTIGQLEMFYAACDLAFVGGSLVPRGGQNMIEPAALGKAVLFGPYVDNFRSDVAMLASARAAVQVRDDAELEDRLVELLADPGARRDLGARAVELIRRNQGATDRTLRMLAPLLEPLAGSGSDDRQQGEEKQAEQSQGQRGPVHGNRP